MTIGVNILFFRVLVTIEPGCSLLQFTTTNCLKPAKQTEAVCTITKYHGCFTSNIPQWRRLTGGGQGGGGKLHPNN